MTLDWKKIQRYIVIISWLADSKLFILKKILTKSVKLILIFTNFKPATDKLFILLIVIKILNDFTRFASPS